jgi:hypothetical protein
VHLLPGPILYCLVKRVVVYSGAWGFLVHQFHLTSSTLSNKYRHALTFLTNRPIEVLDLEAEVGRKEDFPWR